RPTSNGGARMTEADSLPHEGTGPLRAVGSREQHLGALFEMVLTRGPMSRRDAARLTGLSAASVTKLVKPMLNHGYLVENHREAGVPGRPQIPLQVDPERHYAVGIKLMPAEVVGVVVDLHAEVQSSHRMKFRDHSPSRGLRAIVLDGRLWQGASGAAGEFGHVIVDPEGPECHCGKRGCLESVASDAAIVRAMSEATGRRFSKLSQVIALAHAGDADANRVFT